MSVGCLEVSALRQSGATDEVRPEDASCAQAVRMLGQHAEDRREATRRDGDIE